MAAYRENAKEKLSPRQYQEAFNRLIIFPGDDKLYEKTVDYEIEVIDTQKNDKGIHVLVYSQGGFDMRGPLLSYLVDQGIEAIINAQLKSKTSGEIYYGLPVRKKQGVWWKSHSLPFHQ